MGKIKWAVIGTGNIAHTFTDALAADPDAELWAVASRTKEKAEKFAEKYGFRQSYGSYRELAEQSGADVVYIATPMSSHYSDTLLCLKSGINVLCEKTVALNSREFEEMLACVKETGLFFMEAMWMKCRPTYLKAMEWIKQGRIGDVRYIKADFSNYIPFSPESRLFRNDCGGGALLDLGVYPVTLAHSVLGMPDELISEANMGCDGIDLSNHITMRYKDGVFATMDSGFELQLKNNAIISGTEGFITFGNWFHCTETTELYDRNAVLLETSHIPVEVNGYEYEIREVHRCLREELKESPLVTHSDTAEILGLMDKCRQQWGMTFSGRE